MTVCRRMLALSVAAGALSVSVPAIAQTDDPYEHAQPAPPAVHYPPAVPPLHHPDGSVTTEGHVTGPFPGPMPAMSPYPAYPYAPGMMHPAPQAYHAPFPSGFDRDEWLDDCRRRIRGVDRADRGGVIGGLLAGIAGGIIGNRVYDTNRLAGTLIGAGVGGLAGIAIGAAIGAASDRKRRDECAWHLDSYLARYPAYPGNGYGQPGYGYGHGYGFAGYTMMPVVVAVPQRQVIRETVTEEYEEVPVRSRAVTRTRTIHRAAPAPDKRVRYIKGK